MYYSYTTLAYRLPREGATNHVLWGEGGELPQLIILHSYPHDPLDLSRGLCYVGGMEISKVIGDLYGATLIAVAELMEIADCEWCFREKKYVDVDTHDCHGIDCRP